MKRFDWFPPLESVRRMRLFDWFRRKHHDRETRLDNETAVKVGATPQHIRAQEDERLALIRKRLTEIAAK